MPFNVRAETPPPEGTNAQNLPEYAAPDSGAERPAISPPQDFADGFAEVPAPSLRFHDPARRCGNIMPAWDDPCIYATPTSVSIDKTGIRP
jgi:hypothetical protein